MAEAIKCDRCGECSPIIDRLTKGYVQYIKLNKVTNNIYYKNVDLCPKCQEKFRKFMGIDKDE